MKQSQEKKIPKCPKTATGNHIFVNDVRNILSGETSGSIKYTNPYKYNRCLACDLIDDRK